MWSVKVNVFSACASFFIVSIGLMLSSIVNASEQAGLKLEPIHYSGRIAFFLILILAFIFFLAWLGNKSRLFRQLSGAPSQQMRVISVMPLSVKEKIAVVQVGEKQLVIGITPQQINLLCELDTPLESLAAEPSSFSKIFKKSLGS